MCHKYHLLYLSLESLIQPQTKTKADKEVVKVYLLALRTADWETT